jgi:hypothetical protein
MCLQDFYSTDINSIQMASDPAVTAIVTIYSHNTTFGCRGGSRKQESFKYPGNPPLARHEGKKAMNPCLAFQAEIG